MEPAQPGETLRGTCDRDAVDVTSWISVCPKGLCRVQRTQAHEWRQQTVSNAERVAAPSSDYCPKLGSLCCVRVLLKAHEDAGGSVCDERGDRLSDTDVTELVETHFLRCQDSALQIPVGDWVTLRLGEGQCDITETCLEGMRAREKCEIQLSPVGNDDSVPQPHGGNLPLCATVELKSFTPGKESWEMSAAEKWQWVKSHKERGGVRFRSGDLWGAADSYSRALKLLIPLCAIVGEVDIKGQEPEIEEQRETNAADETQHSPSVKQCIIIKAELHSNLSLCQLKLNQPERAKASATKATQLDSGATKAWYRLGQACQMLNELEEAKQAFRKLLELQPELPAAVKALKIVISKEKERNSQLGLRLSKMFS